MICIFFNLLWFRHEWLSLLTLWFTQGKWQCQSQLIIVLVVRFILMNWLCSFLCDLCLVLWPLLLVLRLICILSVWFLSIFNTIYLVYNLFDWFFKFLSSLINKVHDSTPSAAFLLIQICFIVCLQSLRDLSRLIFSLSFLLSSQLRFGFHLSFL